MSSSSEYFPSEEENEDSNLESSSSDQIKGKRKIRNVQSWARN